LARSGVIEVHSEGMQLILKCPLARRHFSVQNKAAINPPQKATINPPEEILVGTGLSVVEASKAEIVEVAKAAIPLNKDYLYIYLLAQFEQFWSLYPEQKSKSKAQAVFEQLNPNAALFQQIMNALRQQIQHRDQLKAQGTWVAPWKYPANWLEQRCWEDGLLMDASQELRHAQHEKKTRARNTGADLFCPPCDEDTDEPRTTNVISILRHQ
jgi:hypothetical protein